MTRAEREPELKKDATRHTPHAACENTVREAYSSMVFTPENRYHCTVPGTSLMPTVSGLVDDGKNIDLEADRNRRYETGGTGGCESEFDEIKAFNTPRLYKSNLLRSHRVASNASTHASARTTKSALQCERGCFLRRKPSVLRHPVSTVVTLRSFGSLSVPWGSSRALCRPRSPHDVRRRIMATSLW